MVAGLDLDRHPPDPSLANWLPESLMRRHQLCPARREAAHIVVAMAQPDDPLAREALNFASQHTVHIEYADAQQIERGINQLIGLNHGLEQAAQALKTGSPADQDRNVVAFVDELLQTAWRREASDIHIEPQEHDCRIRLRIDGELSPCAEVPAGISAQLVTRLKVMANLDIAERRLPQDGRIHFALGEDRHCDRHCACHCACHCDYRVASCPTLHGEKLVLRRLDTLSQLPELSTLGLNCAQQHHLESALAARSGMVLVTGPTGSGKTVTLYSALAQLDPQRLNIATVEDPIEIRMPGLNQVEHAPKAGLSFAVALRAFLRQDPDVLMVGEIRDQATAEIAVRAAQTGHLLLSSLHSEEACSAVARLRNLGIPAYNLVATLRLVIAQRLMRRLHHCCRPYQPTANQLRQHGFSQEELDGCLASGVSLYQPVGCAQCHQGYRGRVGAFEVLPISATMMTQIMAEQPAAALREQARREGITDLRQAARAHVLSGITSLDELQRLGLPTLH